MARILKKSPDTSPDETQTFDRGKMDLAKFGEVTISRVILQPGWSLEKSIKPIQKTETCQLLPHIQYIISGRVGIALEDGNEKSSDLEMLQ